MFHKKTKNAKSMRPLQELTPILPASVMLADVKRADLLSLMKQHSGLEPVRFEKLCLSLIHNLIHHCQSLPETTNSHYSAPCGLVDHALQRTEAALALFREVIVIEEELSEEQKLWMYALFTAGILQNIGKLSIDFEVFLYDANGQLLKPWSPLLEKMTGTAHYYDYEFKAEGDANVRQRLNLLLARFLMPASGYAWIVSNDDVLAVWLALLSDDEQGAGSLAAILSRADAIAVMRYFDELLIKNTARRTGRQGRISTFVDNRPDEGFSKDTIMGVEFIQWLTKQLASGKISINNLHVFVVAGGMLISPELFKMYAKDFPQNKNLQAIQKGVLSLGIHQVGADGNAMTRVDGGAGQKMRTGILISNYAMILPEKMQFKQAKTGELVTVSALELVHMMQAKQSSPGGIRQLSKAGAWDLLSDSKQQSMRTSYSG